MIEAGVKVGYTPITISVLYIGMQCYSLIKSNG